LFFAESVRRGNGINSEFLFVCALGILNMFAPQIGADEFGVLIVIQVSAMMIVLWINGIMPKEAKYFEENFCMALSKSIYVMF
jgi:hypothetical protein